MDLKIKHFVVFITIVLLLSCKEDREALVEIEGQLLKINDSVSAQKDIDAFVAPYQTHINKVLDSSLAYAPRTLTKEDGTYNTSMGNLMADIVLEMANPIFKARTGMEIDFVLLNSGGIRSLISKGKITARTAYEVMPFENTVVVVQLDGTSVRELVSFLISSKSPHPISGLLIVANKNKRIESVDIKGKPFDETRNYFVATSNYLVDGGDNMVFLKKSRGTMETGYYIRNAMIDYFKKVDTLKAEVDDRFIKRD